MVGRRIFVSLCEIVSEQRQVTMQCEAELER